jgi:hypothetical protein
MSEHAKLVGGVGVVLVGALEITVTPLSAKEEKILDRQLAKAAEALSEDPYTAARKTLKAAESNPADRLVLLQEIAAAATRKQFLTVGEFNEYRMSSAGVALELFTRGKKATPGLVQKELAALVTEFNAEDIYDEMKTIITSKGEEGGDEKKATP